MKKERKKERNNFQVWGNKQPVQTQISGGWLWFCTQVMKKIKTENTLNTDSMTSAGQF